MLSLPEKGTQPHVVWWREWSEGNNGVIEKVCYDSTYSHRVAQLRFFRPIEGMFQNNIILYILSYAHFIEHDKIPNPYELENNVKPAGPSFLHYRRYVISVDTNIYSL